MLTICSQHVDQWSMGGILTILTTRWLPGQDHSYDLDHPEA
jgi:hypothetical protein